MRRTDGIAKYSKCHKVVFALFVFLQIPCLCVCCLTGIFFADGEGRRVHLARCASVLLDSNSTCGSTASPRMLFFVLAGLTLLLHEATSPPTPMQRNASFFCSIADTFSHGCFLCSWRNRVVPVDVRRHTICVDTAIYFCVQVQAFVLELLAQRTPKIGRYSDGCRFFFNFRVLRELSSTQRAIPGIQTCQS